MEEITSCCAALEYNQEACRFMQARRRKTCEERAEYAPQRLETMKESYS
jgi:hypothetical protein